MPIYRVAMLSHATPAATKGFIDTARQASCFLVIPAAAGMLMLALRNFFRNELGDT